MYVRDKIMNELWPYIFQLNMRKP